MLPELGDRGLAVAYYDEDLAHDQGDIYCEGCFRVINAHLTDYHYAMSLNIFDDSQWPPRKEIPIEDI